MWAPEHEPKALEKAKATRELRDEEGVIVVDDIRDMAPDQMTRAQIVRALRAYMVLPSSGELHDWYELLSAAKILLARETYEDGVGKKRCALCLSLRLLQNEDMENGNRVEAGKDAKRGALRGGDHG